MRAERHACAELQEAYAEHQKRLVGDARARAEQAKAEVRQHFEQYTAAQAAQQQQQGGASSSSSSGGSGQRP
jgi:hypothetical protein